MQIIIIDPIKVAWITPPSPLGVWGVPHQWLGGRAFDRGERVLFQVGEDTYEMTYYGPLHNAAAFGLAPSVDKELMQRIFPSA